MTARVLCLSLLVTLGSGCSTSHGADELDGGLFFLDVRAVDAPPVTDADEMDDTGALPDADLTRACSVPSDCTLRPASCCGSCGAATPEDMIALADGVVEAYVAAVCRDVGCPECAQEPDPYLLATCRESACVAVNLHVDPLTECNTDADCTLAAAECCACGLLATSEIIAFNSAGGSLGSLICDPDADCPPCVPDFGSHVGICNAGRCEVGGPE